MGQYLHYEQHRSFFEERGQNYRVALLGEYYESGMVDATWHCIWCWEMHDPAGRTVEQLCWDLALDSSSARQRSWGQAWRQRG